MRKLSLFALCVLLIAIFAFKNDEVYSNEGHQHRKVEGEKIGITSPAKISGTWSFTHQGNTGVLNLSVRGSSVSGEMIVENGSRSKISGEIEPIGKWNVMKISFSRSGEPQEFTGYTMTHGSMSGMAMAGSFTYRGQVAGSWYAKRLVK